MHKFKYIVLTLLLVALFGGIFWFFRNSNKPVPMATETETKEENNAEVSPENVERKEVKILFVGDMMFDRYIREVAAKKGNDFVLEKVVDFLKSEDLVVGNLEGPITDKNSVSVGTEIGAKGHLVFTFHPSWAQTLAENNIKLMNLGNNHILNFGIAGLDETKNYLKNAGIDYFNQGETLIKDVGDWKIGFVSYNQFGKNSEEKALTDIAEAKKQADFVFVYAHWGKEYENSVSPSIKELGRKFIDAGADLVIGSHPHVVQAKEDYNGKKIYYSLGNFVFDQYFSSDTMKGLAVQVIINPGGNLSFQEFEVRMKSNGQTEIN